MSDFQHRFIDVNRTRLHLVESGSGPAVVLCHGFPELWYSWRHQLPALADAGFRAIALDMRGHGESQIPPTIDEYDVTHTVGDVIGILDALGIDRAALVGHDAGTSTAYHAALMRPDRVRGVMGLSVPYIARGEQSILEAFDGAVPLGFYMQYFQQSSRPEADLSADVKETLKRLFFANSGLNPDVPFIMTVPENSTLVASLPAPVGPIPFLPDDELSVYVDSYSRTGFQGGLNGYRTFQRNWEITAPWNGMPLPVPSAFIGGTSDTVLHFPGFRDAAECMGNALFLDGAGHWIQSERPDEVNASLIDFLKSLPR